MKRKERKRTKKTEKKRGACCIVLKLPAYWLLNFCNSEYYPGIYLVGLKMCMETTANIASLWANHYIWYEHLIGHLGL
jgi:hypothetical protein